MKQINLLLFLIFIIFSQKDLTVLIHKKQTNIQKFEKKFIENIVSLYNKRNKEKFIIKFRKKNTFLEYFGEIKNSKKSDFICAIDAITNSDLRQQMYSLSEPYLPTMGVIATTSSYPEKDSLDWQKSGRRVGVVSGSQFEHYKDLWDILTQSKLVMINHRTEFVEKINQNRIHYAINDELLTIANPDLRVQYYFTSRLLVNYSILYPKNSPLKNLFDPYIIYFRKSPAYMRLLRRTFGKEGMGFIKEYFRNIYNKKDVYFLREKDK
jgi:hypothetical protein